MSDEQDRNVLSDYLTKKGYRLVLPTCPECGYGQIVQDEQEHSFCTAYGQCELAPG